MLSHPALTIIIPTFNRPEELSRALSSIRHMNTEGVYTIVINDASTVDYGDIVKKFDDVIEKYIILPLNNGVSYARNEGIRHATTEWILFLDDDDEFNIHYIQEIRKYIYNNNLKEYDFLWCNIESRLLDNQRNLLATKIIKPRLRANKPEDLIYAALSIGASYGLALNKAFIEKFDASFPVGEDIDFIMRILQKGFHPHHINTVGVVKYNYKFGSDLTSNNNKAYSDKCIVEKILAKHHTYLMTLPLYYPYFIAWGVRCHYKNNNWIYGDELLQYLFIQKKLISYILYVTLKLTKYIK